MWRVRMFAHGTANTDRGLQLLGDSLRFLASICRIHSASSKLSKQAALLYDFDGKKNTFSKDLFGQAFCIVFIAPWKGSLELSLHIMGSLQKLMGPWDDEDVSL